jgi:CCR4-NOT transcriptional complex subunit CAF120
MPQFINITDAIITMTNPQENPEHYYVLSLSTAGSNRYLFEFQNPNVLKRWSAAFRIAMYERAALQECYTAALIARARNAPNVRRLFSA